MPTVEAGPTTRQMPTTAATGAEPSLPDLISEKDRVESELMALGSVLESVGSLEILPSMRTITDI